MIQVYREIRDAVILSRRAFEMRLGAASESVHGDFVSADGVTAAIEIAHFDLDRPRVCACIAEIALD